jgi:hypothetical protein
MAQSKPLTLNQARLRSLAKRATDILIWGGDRVDTARRVTYMIAAFTADETEPTDEQLTKLERMLDKVRKNNS